MDRAGEPDFERYRRDLQGGRRGFVEVIVGIAAIPLFSSVGLTVLFDVPPEKILLLLLIGVGYLLGAPVGVHGLILTRRADRAQRRLRALVKEEWRSRTSILPPDLASQYRPWPSVEPPALTEQQVRRVRLARRFRIGPLICVLFMWGFLGYVTSLAVLSNVPLAWVAQVGVVLVLAVLPWVLLGAVLLEVGEGVSLYLTLREYESSTGRMALPRSPDEKNSR